MVVIISCAIIIVLFRVIPRPSNDPPVIDSATGNAILYYSNRYKLMMGIIPLQMSLTLYYLFFIRLSGDPDMVIRFELWFVTLMPLLSGLWAITEAFFCRMVLTNDSIIFHRLILRPQTLEWTTISRISCLQHSVEIRSISGQKIKVSEMMNGFQTFIKTITLKSPPTVAMKASADLQKYNVAP